MLYKLLMQICDIGLYIQIYLTWKVPFIFEDKSCYTSIHIHTIFFVSEESTSVQSVELCVVCRFTVLTWFDSPV